MAVLSGIQPKKKSMSVCDRLIYIECKIKNTHSKYMSLLGNGGLFGGGNGGGGLGNILQIPLQIMQMPFQMMGGILGGGLTQMLMPFIIIFVGVELAFKLIDKI
jgi:hypothetical protein